MPDLYELKQLAAFADLGTLSKVAEEFHISTPSVTRSMQLLGYALPGENACVQISGTDRSRCLQ